MAWVWPSFALLLSILIGKLVSRLKGSGGLGVVRSHSEV